MPHTLACFAITQSVIELSDAKAAHHSGRMEYVVCVGVIGGGGGYQA